MSEYRLSRFRVYFQHSEHGTFSFETYARNLGHLLEMFHAMHSDAVSIYLVEVQDNGLWNVLQWERGTDGSMLSQY